MKIIISYLTNFLLIMIFIFTSFSCKREKNEQKSQLFNKLVKKNIGIKLIISDNIQMYSPFSNYILSESTEIEKAEFKIYSRINVYCVSCIGDIELWDELSSEFSKYNVPIILILGTKNDFEFIKYLCESGEVKEFDYPFFLDIKSEYIEQNKFMVESSDFETVLTDKDNNILLLGNPIHSIEIKELYLNELEKRMKKE